MGNFLRLDSDLRDAVVLWLQRVIEHALLAPVRSLRELTKRAVRKLITFRVRLLVVFEGLSAKVFKTLCSQPGSDLPLVHTAGVSPR